MTSGLKRRRLATADKRSNPRGAPAAKPVRPATPPQSPRDYAEEHRRMLMVSLELATAKERILRALLIVMVDRLRTHDSEDFRACGEELQSILQRTGQLY